MQYLSRLIIALLFISNAYAEGIGKGGDEFRNTAAEYQMKAEKYSGKGKSDIAAMYARLAEIKLDAAAKADEGEWDAIDWSEYHEIEGKIAKLKTKADKK